MRDASAPLPNSVGFAKPQQVSLSDGEWPAHVIASGSCCPLSSAAPTNGAVFRRNDGHFESRYQTMVDNGKVPFPNDPKQRCRSTALSCFYTQGEHDENVAVHEGWAALGTIVAHLTPEHGVIEQSGNDPRHFSLWLKRKYLANADTLFKVLP